MMELRGLTGLMMGGENKDHQAYIDVLMEEAAEHRLIEALHCAPMLKPFGCSGISYLEANPNVRIWTERNPQMVPADKARLRANN